MSAVTYVETSSPHSTQVIVSSTGAVTTSGTLPVGDYAVGGTTSDTYNNTGTWTYTLTVTAGTITQSAPTTGTVATTGSSAFTDQLATSGALSAVTYGETSSPHSTQVIVSSTGAVTTSGSLPVGDYTVGGSTSDTFGNAGTWTYTLTVTAGTITQTAPITGTASTTSSPAFTDQLAVTGSTGPVTYAETSSPHSIQVLISSSGAVTTAGALPAGSYAVSGTTSDTFGDTGTWTYTLTVDEAATITSVDLATFHKGSLGTFTVTATGSPAPTFSKTGALPSGVTLDSTTGILSGTPSQSGSFPITIAAANGVIPAATQPFTLTVDDPAAITSIDHVTVTQGSAGTFTVTASGYPAPTFSETGPLPTGVALDATTGVLAGAAGEPGSFPITITAHNGIGPDATQPFTLTVNHGLISQSSPTGATVAATSSAAFTSQLHTTGNVASVTFIETASSASGQILVSTSGAVTTSGPLTAGEYTVSGTTSDGTGRVGTWTFTLAVTDSQSTSGYRLVGSDGGVFSFGGPPYEGSLPDLGVRVSNIVGMVSTTDGKGYWMVGSDGGVFAFGDAGFIGSLPGLGVHVNDVVAFVPTPTGKGYWMVGSDGGVFAFGDAGFVGSLPGLGVHVSDVVGVVPTSDGLGYWMVGSDGGVFAFGDAGFVGSLPGLGVHVGNIVGIIGTADHLGYTMVGADGGVFPFGDAKYEGSLPALGVHVSNVVGILASGTGNGYSMVGNNGSVYTFGDSVFAGSLPGLGVNVTNIVAIVAG